MRIALTLLISLVLAGCAQHSAPRQAQEPTPQPMSGPATVPARDVAALDHEVLEAVFADLLSEKKTPLANVSGPPAEILFSMDADRYSQTVVEVLKRHDEASWAKLSPAQLKLAEEAADHFVQRLQREDFFHPFVPADSRVKVYHEPPPTTDVAQSLNRQFNGRPVMAWTPGYSTDHRFAVVKLILPWSMHHADGLYLLAYEDGKWKVVMRQFIYYV